jgi:predicted aspartyl protease
LHTYADIEICGSKSCKKLKHVLVDTGSSFTTITREDAEEVGIPYTMEGDFRTMDKESSKHPIGAVRVKMNGKDMWNLITLSENVRVIGALSLESLGLKVDPTKGKIEDAGPYLA